MPSKPLKACRKPGCPALTRDRFCKAHQRQQYRQQDQNRGTSTQRGYNSAWRNLRLLKLHSNPLCEQCEKNGIVKAGNEVDHIIPLNNGGTNSMDNLQTLCKPCHSAKTMRESVSLNA